MPNDFPLVLVGLILLFMAATEYLGRRRALEQSYRQLALPRRSGGDASRERRPHGGVFTALGSGRHLAASRFLRRARRDGVRAGGVLNIGLEGMMLIGAYVGFSCALYSGFTWVGLGAASSPVWPCRS